MARYSPILLSRLKRNIIYLMKIIFGFAFLSLLLFAFIPAFSLAANKININTATLEQLDELVGIGPKYAQAIIDGRPFSSVGDLLRIKGIGEKTLQKIKEQGWACVDCQTEIANETNNQIASQSQTPAAETETLTPVVYSKGIIINEILPAPEGADATEEWIEIFNQNDSEVDLTDWKIKDKIGTTTSYVFPAGKKIAAKEYLVLTRPVTKITLNNSGDGLEIINPNNEVIDTVDFGSALKNQSYNRTGSGWIWSTTLTPGKENIVPKKSPAQPTKKTQNVVSQPTNQTNSEPIKNNPPLKEETATASEKIPSPSNFPFVLFLSITIALASGLGILLLKKKLLQK